MEIFLKICLCWFYFIIQTSYTNFEKNFFFKTIYKSKNNSLTVQIFFNPQNHPTFDSEERLVNLVRGRECFGGLSIL